MKRALVLLALAVCATTVPRAGSDPLAETFTNWIDHPAIAYRTRPPDDPVARLNRRLEEGSARLTFDGRGGFLRSVLGALKIPVESQVVVFSPDSLQGTRISTVNPRAIFFNDAVSVAFVRGGFLEFAAQDPRQGIVFYALDNTPDDRPRFTRRQDCLSCHYARTTVGVPGMVDQGYAQLNVDHRTPFAKRWGGWYVTGQPSALPHLGNHVTRMDDARGSSPPAAASPIWPSFAHRFDTTGYPAGTSDVVALLAFNHQMRGMNLLARVGWEARVAAFDASTPQAAMVARPGTRVQPPIPIDAAARELVDYFLFVDEPALPSPVRGSSGFAEWFEAQGPRDGRGRSLRQLDLDTRLLRYPCSYLIYSEAFDALPEAARHAIYARLLAVLSGAEPDPRYRRLAGDTGRAILEILTDTRPEIRPHLSRPPAP